MQAMISVPRAVLAALLAMADSHVEDIRSGVEEHLYDAAENIDLPVKEQAVASARALLDASACPDCGGCGPVDSVHVGNGLTWICDSCPDGTAAWAAVREWHQHLADGRTTLGFAEWMLREREARPEPELPIDLKKVLDALALAKDCGGELDRDSYKAAHDGLLSLVATVRQYDDAMDAAERPPTGDDYNELLSLLGLAG